MASLPVSSGGAGQVLSPPRGFGIVCLESVLLFASGVSTNWIFSFLITFGCAGSPLPPRLFSVLVY